MTMHFNRHLKSNSSYSELIKKKERGKKKHREIGFVYIDNGDECFKSKWQFIRQTYSRAIDMIDKTIHHIERLFDFHIFDGTQSYLSDVSTLFSN